MALRKVTRVWVSFLALACELTVTAYAQDTGTSPTGVGGLTGTIRGEGASVLVDRADVTASNESRKWSTQSDANGRFKLELPAGIYRLVVYHPDYDERTLLNVEVAAGTTKDANVTLHKGVGGSSAGGIEEMTVTGRYDAAKLEDPRFSASVVSALNREDFAITGDTGVVDALARVTGVTVVGDKYVYVRGLGERYSSTLFNNAMLPSPDPTRRVVPLDLFPSGVMEQLSITKTYAPHLPADFSGGSLELTTREIPLQRDVGLKLAIEHNTETTYRNVPWPVGDKYDWTGFEGGFRAFPALIHDLSVDGRLPAPGDLTPEQLTDVGLAINRDYNIQDQIIPPNITLNASYGNTYDLPGPGTFGLLIGGRAENKWQYTDEERRTSQILQGPDGNPTPTIRDNFNQQETDNEIKYSALASAELALNDDQQFRTTLFYTQQTDKRYFESLGYKAENDKNLAAYNWEWEERQLWSAQLTGDHHFEQLSDLTIDWGTTYGRARRREPDSRYYLYELTGDNGYIFATDAASNARTWEDLKDETWDVFLDGAVPVDIAADLTTTFKAGTRYFHRDRRSDLNRYRFENRFDFNDYLPIATLPPNGVFDDPNIGPNKWELTEVTVYSDTYTAEEEIAAGYIETDSEIFQDWRLLVGARYENSIQKTESLFPIGGTPVKADLEKGYVLPAVTLTWSLREDMQLRTAFSQTINRPDIREISIAPFVDPETRDVYTGNPDLEIAEIMNYDFAWQWYYTKQDSLELGAFYKDLQKPIEEILKPAGSTIQYSWANADSAILYGIEVSQRQSLARLGDWARWLYYKGNGAWIFSEVKSAGFNETNDNRPLQGQSPWVVNFELVYDSLPHDIQAALSFNMAGERLDNVGIQGFDDAYDQPVPRLDFNYGQGFKLWGQFMRAGFRAKNVLDPEHRITRDGVTENKYTDGASFEVSLEMEF